MPDIAQTTMHLEFDLFEVMACPQCHEALEEHSMGSGDGNELICTGCVERYPIQNGVPRFTHSMHTPEFASQYKSTNSVIKERLGTKAHSILWKLYRNPLITTSESRRLETEELPELLSSDAKVLNLGSGQFSKDSALFRQYKTRMINLDIASFGDVHIVGDAHSLPFFNNSLDLVYMSCVLEHVRDARVVVEECHRVLKDGGYLYSSTPFVSRHHGDSDYRRWTFMGLDYLFQHFEKVATGIHCGPASAIALALREFFPLFFGSGYLHFAVKFVMGWLLTPLAYLDLLLTKNRLAYKLAQSYYYLGQKKK